MAEKILVISGKGGVGKSTVTVCLADALTKLGKSVLCIDADIGFRSLDLIAGTGTDTVYNWLDVIDGGCTAAAAPVKNGGYSVLSAPNDFSESITAESVSELLGKYDADFDYIFVDAPAGSDELHKYFAAAVDTALLIVTPDPVCVRSAEVAVSRAENANNNINTKLIINRFNKAEVLTGRQLKLDDVIDATHTQLIGVIPENSSIRLLQGGAGLSRYAESFFSRCARRLTGEQILFNIKEFYR